LREAAFALVVLLLCACVALPLAFISTVKRAKVANFFRESEKIGAKAEFDRIYRIGRILKTLCLAFYPI